MNLDAFLLAEAAVTLNGKLYIHGGGITEIEAPLLPWTHPQLAMVIRLSATPQEADEEHELGMVITDPANEVIFPRYPFPVPERPSASVSDEIFFDLTLTLSPVTFAVAGSHRVVIDLDGTIVRSTQLLVVEGNE